MCCKKIIQRHAQATNFKKKKTKENAITKNI